MTQKPLLQNYILPNAAAKEAIKQTPLATASSIPALQVSNLAFAYDKGRKIFSDVSFSLQRGEIMQILGANGSGKSTLMNCLAHQLKPQQGQILVEGDELGALPREELARRIAAWVCPEPKVKTGYLARYAKMVSSADKGAILE